MGGGFFTGAIINIQSVSWEGQSHLKTRESCNATSYTVGVGRSTQSLLATLRPELVKMLLGLQESRSPRNASCQLYFFSSRHPPPELLQLLQLLTPDSFSCRRGIQSGLKLDLPGLLQKHGRLGLFGAEE
jgi:hypothetical protein